MRIDFLSARRAPKQGPGHRLESLRDKADEVAQTFAASLDTYDSEGTLDMTAHDLRLKYVEFMRENPSLPRVPFRLILPKLTKVTGPSGVLITNTDDRDVTWYMHRRPASISH